MGVIADNSGKGKHHNVLVVDDHAEMRHIIADYVLKRGDCSVVEAANGLAAMRCLDEHNIDFIISDWDMPQFDGIDLLQQVRKNAKYQDMPFMLVSSDAERRRVELALAAGVDMFMVKPFTAKTLQSKLNHFLRMSRHEGVSKTFEKQLLEGQVVSGEQQVETILIVDDTPAIIDVISNILRDDYTVLAATSGSKALQLVGNKEIDLILLDIMMPGMDGMDVCRRLKADPLGASIPIIFLTAKVGIDDIANGLDAGAVDYITKPANPRILKARVRAQLALKRERDHLSQQVDMLIENARLREETERISQQDLKKPLKEVINTIDLMLRGQMIDMEQTVRSKRIQSSAYEMLRMIDHSLDLYKMEAGLYKIDSVSFDIVDVAYRVVEASRHYANDAGVSILFDAPDMCFALGEELLTYSLLSSLLRNAIEASSNGSHVRVGIVCNDPVVVTVNNQGEVPAHIRDNFFEKFLAASHGGGVGAYSAKLMAELQGGSLSLRTSVERGTTLLLTLPRGIRQSDEIL